MRKCPLLHTFTTIWDISYKQSHVFFYKTNFFDMPNNAPNTTERQHRKHFMVRNDEKEATCLFDLRRNKATSLYMLRVSVLLCRSKAATSLSFMSLLFVAAALAISRPFPAGSKVHIYASRVHVDSMSLVATTFPGEINVTC